MVSKDIDAIEVAHLRKSYKGVVAVADVDFKVAQGSVTALLGGNGAGKTTTIGLILGLILPDSGTIKVLGHDMARERHLALHLMNFESPYVALPHRLTVRQNLQVFAMLYGISEIGARIEELARDLELKAFLDREAGKLSAGQKTRISLAKALINRPKLLLLDEPTASLDPDTADWVRSRLLDFRAASGSTIFMASHNMTEVERMCDDAIIMKAGGIVDRGAPKQLIAQYGRDNLEQVFLDIARDPNLAPRLEVGV